MLSLLNFYCLYDIDVNSALFPTEEHHVDYIESIESSVSSIVIPDWTCNDASYIEFDFSRFTNLETLEIGDDCFSKVNVFRIDGLHKLRRIKIGKNSFTQSVMKNRFNSEDSEDTSQSFSITNCRALSQIIIGEYSFSTFAGDFTLASLPSLKTIQIGVVGKKSHNFYSCSFALRSNNRTNLIE